MSTSNSKKGTSVEHDRQHMVKSVLKARVQFCLIASLIARVHGEVRSLSKSS